jgi:NADH dehydrogenase
VLLETEKNVVFFEVLSNLKVSVVIAQRFNSITMKTNKETLRTKKHLVIIGGGYAGFWSALSAIRQSRDIEKLEELEVTLINADNYFTMRPRLYEVSLEGLRVKLDDYLKPLGIKQIIGKAEIIDADSNEVIVATAHGTWHLAYDYLILAAGSSLKALNLPGIENTFNIDTYTNAEQLEAHIITLAKRNFENEGDNTFVIAGAGLTGLEAVTSIEDKVKKMQELYSTSQKDIKVVLVERHNEVGSYYSPDAKAYLNDTIVSKNIQVMTESEIIAIEPSRVILTHDVEIATSTVIWTIGMTASPLTRFLKGKRDSLNRIYVDGFLKLNEYPNVIVAGDVANVKVGQGQTAVMSCQFSQFQGRWAGHNAVNDMFGLELKEYIQNGYTTCLDLGGDNALITDGWDRIVHKTGTDGKAIKTWICTDLIYPHDDVEEALADSYPKIPKF